MNETDEGVKAALRAMGDRTNSGILIPVFMPMGIMYSWHHEPRE
jgi:hypothetical protein